MSNLKEFYALDFINLFNSRYEIELFNNVTQTAYKISLTLHMDMTSQVKFCSLYVSESLSFDLLQAILPKIGSTLNLKIEENRDIILPDLPSKFIGQKIKISNHGDKFDLKFLIEEGEYSASNFLNAPVLYIYTENNLASEEIAKIKNLGAQCNLNIIIRDKIYENKRLKQSKPLAFISHDSRDKDIARMVAEMLQKRDISVWFDEFSLKIGDPIRQSIEKGIKDSKKCILLLTPNFLNNPGWTKFEFESIFQKNMHEGQQAILPIWHNIIPSKLYEYSPVLQGVLGRAWNDDPEDQKRIIREISLLLDPVN
jgi:hypothetical protein